ncbi:hypothetical protein C8R47DRAFT_722108 [Mycena vitilis]|nr:hypothetical protein C8R47DRAFT_722108 [Mycena vitilis]
MDLLSSQPSLPKVRSYTRRRPQLDPNPTIPGPPPDYELYRADMSAWMPSPASFSALMDPDFPHQQPRLRKRPRTLVQTAGSSATPHATNLSNASQIAQFARRPQLELLNIPISPANPESYKNDTSAKSSHQESQQHKPQWQPETTEAFAVRVGSTELKSSQIERTTCRPAALRVVAKPTVQANSQNSHDPSHEMSQKPIHEGVKRDARGEVKLGQSRVLQPLALAMNVHAKPEMQPPSTGNLNPTLYPYPYPYRTPPYALVPAHWIAPGSDTILAHTPKRPSLPAVQAEPKRSENSSTNSNFVFPRAPTSSAEKDTLVPPSAYAYPTLALLLADLNRLLRTPHAGQTFLSFRGTCAGVRAPEHREARVVDVAREIIATTVLSFECVSSC